MLKLDLGDLDDAVRRNNDDMSSLLNSKKGGPLSAQSSPIVSTQSAPVAADVNQSMGYLKEQHDDLVKRRTDTEERLNNEWKTELTKSTQDRLADTHYIAATFLTRIAILAILVFLVRILIDLLRFNMRLGAFYASRTDSVRIWNGAKLEDLKRLTELFTPIGVDFGKEPRHPIDYMLDALRSILPKASRAQSNTKQSPRASKQAERPAPRGDAEQRRAA
jgi:hypothetical protein